MSEKSLEERAERCRLMALEIGGPSLARTVSKTMEADDGE